MVSAKPWAVRVAARPAASAALATVENLEGMALISLPRSVQ
jgi:hypothetical protein